jgi:chitodextrinase
MRFIPSLLQWSFGQGTLQFWWWQIFVADGQKNDNVGGLQEV